MGEDPESSVMYNCWWDAHRPVRLSIPGVLEADELRLPANEVIGGDEDGLIDRVVVG